MPVPEQPKRRSPLSRLRRALPKMPTNNANGENGANAAAVVADGAPNAARASESAGAGAGAGANNQIGGVATATQVSVALFGLLFLSSGGGGGGGGGDEGAFSVAGLNFEPWGTAAAVLFTWGIVRSEVLVAKEGLAAKARIAAVQTSATALLAATWAAGDVLALTTASSASGGGGGGGGDAVIPNATTTIVEIFQGLPLGQLTYLGVLTGVVSTCELVAVNRFTQGYAVLAFGFIPITGAAWQRLAGGDGANLAYGIGQLSWGEVIALVTAIPPTLLFALTRLRGSTREEPAAADGGGGKRGGSGAGEWLARGVKRAVARVLGREEEEAKAASVDGVMVCMRTS